ncbi:unnamed protein product [Orchesella dallaii]|uniref:Uncharacterized protein n=1 Tax=Orchesella dallaii TaxID=48710 RepID=A0ABP1RNX3_9HEXA
MNAGLLENSTVESNQPKYEGGGELKAIIPARSTTFAIPSKLPNMGNSTPATENQSQNVSHQPDYRTRESAGIFGGPVFEANASLIASTSPPTIQKNSTLIVISSKDVSSLPPEYTQSAETQARTYNITDVTLLNLPRVNHTTTWHLSLNRTSKLGLLENSKKYLPPKSIVNQNPSNNGSEGDTTLLIRKPSTAINATSFKSLAILPMNNSIKRATKDNTQSFSTQPSEVLNATSTESSTRSPTSNITIGILGNERIVSRGDVGLVLEVPTSIYTQVINTSTTNNMSISQSLPMISEPASKRNYSQLPFLPNLLPEESVTNERNGSHSKFARQGIVKGDQTQFMKSSFPATRDPLLIQTELQSNITENTNETKNIGLELDDGFTLSKDTPLNEKLHTNQEFEINGICNFYLNSNPYYIDIEVYETYFTGTGTPELVYHNITAILTTAGIAKPKNTSNCQRLDKKRLQRINQRRVERKIRGKACELAYWQRVYLYNGMMGKKWHRFAMMNPMQSENSFVRLVSTQ